MTNSTDKLIAAIYTGSDDPKRLLSEIKEREPNFDINTLGTCGHTPLHCATASKVDGVIALLLTNGADPNTLTHSGNTALHFATLSGEITNIALLLTAGANIEAITSDGNKALIYAIDSKKVELVDLLLQAGASITPYTLEDGAIVSPLHHAIKKGSFECTKLLLDAGADIYSTTHTGELPLDSAVNKGRNNIVELLLKAGASTELHRLVSGRIISPLHIAIKKCTPECIEQLIPASSNAVINHQNSSGMTPLMLTLSKGYIGPSKLLLQREQNLDLINSKGNTALHMAAHQEQPQFISTIGHLFLLTGKSIDIPNRRGETALHTAAKYNCPEGANTLIRLGADPMAMNINGLTPMHYARGDILKYFASTSKEPLAYCPPVNRTHRKLKKHSESFQRPPSNLTITQTCGTIPSI